MRRLPCIARVAFFVLIPHPLLSTDGTSLGDRMKRNYEGAYTLLLPCRMPVVIRIDGKAFHTWTRGIERPFSDTFIGWW